MFKIKGELKSFKPVDKVYFFYRDGDNSQQDSSQLKDGEFKFEGKVSEPTVARLQVKYAKQEGEEKAKSEFFQFFLEPAKIDIVAKDSLKNNTVKGAKGQADFEKLQKEEDAYSPRLEKLYADYGTARKAGNKEEMNKIEKEIETSR